MAVDYSVSVSRMTVVTGLFAGLLTGCALAGEPSVACTTASPALVDQLAEGDIILQRSRSQQSVALRAATGSPWTHVGLVFEHKGQWQVLEAVQPVRWTPLQRWVDRGKDGEVVVMRYPGAFDADALQAAGESYLGLPYDTLFQWSDERIYCSELVYKAWEKVGVEVGVQRPMGSFDLSSKEVRGLIAARTTDGIEEGEPVVAPSAFMEDERLIVVVGSR